MGVMDEAECYTLEELQEATGKAFGAGERKERARLRLLLERCLAILEQDVAAPDTVAALRRELGKEG